ncbi:UDP-glucosyl transferase 88A1 [Hibiscus syriacus]|uniref:UDP-glucosyl transferase 88A1 n=1 Tax=Hibiscus syriacus TaxID=106335 RepID=A0A6A2ZPM7_HIBSY|nr:UDP-glucosyl transferase 88A1 [Hibiscus syriacus]
MRSTKSSCFLHGKLAHAHIIKSASKPCLFLQNNLLSMYCKAGEMNVGRRLFDKMSQPNFVSYNSLISGYNQMGAFDKAMQVFIEGRKTCLKLDQFTYAGALNVCTQTGDLKLGVLIHGLVLVSGLIENAFLTNSLIDMYCKCACVEQARYLFENSKEIDEISWNTLISGYVRMNQNEEMLKLLISMHRNGLNLNTYTMGSVLKACCTSTDVGIKYGKMLHGCIMKLGFQMDIVVGTSLLDICAQHGCATDALNLFGLMKEREITPNHITFVGILSACSYGGLVEEGLRYFESMKDYDVETSIEHYCCVADLFGRAGRLAEAQNFILTSVFKNNPIMWRALLSSCRVYKDTVTGKRAAVKVIGLQPQGSASYVLLHNIYAAAAVETLAVGELMQQRGVKKKEPGLSWI